ncbi:MAG: hypothetical protein FVQ82_05765 [Planctomycetes bacterium]|nr:hypothetical protein [Planctomycetota bacterium]
MKTSLNISRNLDWRSLIIGLLVGMMVLLASGHQSGQRYLGRYIPISAGNSEDTIFIVDTYCGQTWRMNESSTIDYGIPNHRKMPESRKPDNDRLK